MIKSYEDIIDTAVAYRESRILVSGIELDLFTQLGHEALSAAELARKTNTLNTGLEILLNALSGIGLLKKENDLYSNTGLSLKYLCSSSAASINNYLWLAAQSWNQWDQLTEIIRGNIDKTDASEPQHPELKDRFSQAVNERSLKIIPELLKHIQVGKAKSLLDLGAGDGSYALAILEKNPELRITVFDRPAMIKAATIRAFNSDTITKLKFVSGDFFKDDLGGPYDIILLSNIIHIFGETDNRRLLEKTVEALHPEGRLLIVDAFLEDDRTHPPEAAVFSVELFLRTASGRCYTWSDVSSWLAPLGITGFKRVRINERVAVLEAQIKSRH
jgi:SAM-dependent methyltransferase